MDTVKKECSRNMAVAKFIIFSFLGIFMFFVSIEINGTKVIDVYKRQIYHSSNIRFHRL